MNWVIGFLIYVFTGCVYYACVIVAMIKGCENTKGATDKDVEAVFQAKANLWIKYLPKWLIALLVIRDMLLWPLSALGSLISIFNELKNDLFTRIQERTED